MSGDGKPVRRRAELYVRSLRPDGYCQQQSSVLDRIAGLEERGVLTERDVQVCGRQVPATLQETKTAVGERILGRVSAFREWATRNDCALTPAFELREVHSGLTDTHYRALRVPTMVLAEYRAGELLCVTPHYDGDRVRTVRDRVTELEAGDPTPFERVSDPERPREREQPLRLSDR